MDCYWIMSHERIQGFVSGVKGAYSVSEVEPFVACYIR